MVVTSIGLLTAGGAVADEGRPDDRRTIAEGVVAIVDGQPILWSALRSRVRQALIHVAPGQRAAAYAEALAAELDRLIDDRLVQAQAERYELTVSAEEIARAFATIASERGETVEELHREIERVGWTRAEYDVEVGMQVLRYKVLARAHSEDYAHRPATTSADWAALDRQLLKDLRARATIEKRLAP